MKLKNIKKKIGYLIILVVVSASVFQIFNLSSTKNFTEGNNHKQVHTSAQASYIKQWIENSDFSSTDNWNSSKGELGDSNDVNASINSGVANYNILGDRGTFSLIADPPTSSQWRNTSNPDYPAPPDDQGIDDTEGCWIQHQFTESPLSSDQIASVHWEHNVTMPVNMSDYVITSASLTAVFNATADENIECPGDQANYFSTYDWARFYVLISNENNVSYEVARYQMNDLGVGDGSGPHYKGDTSMITIPEESLIIYLTSILNYDYLNFNVTLGILVWCEDNRGTETDDWDYLLINNFNLTFTYEKKIDQLTSISWNQEGDKPSDISSSTVVVDEAILNFKYKINDTWPNLSPNSEIQVLINGIKHSETINLLGEANETFQDAGLGGFDVTYLIEEDKNINLSIQVYLADDFELNRTIAISIDDVSLDISYTVYFNDYQTNLHLFLNGDNKTLSPSTELPIGQNLTITVKYTDQVGGHIPGAEVLLTGIGLIENLKEFTNNYSITLNATQKLSMGVNYLEIEAKKTNHETKNINPTINIRKIIGEIKTVSGNSTIDIDVGENVQLEIMLNDTDNEELIRGAIVTYTWDLDSIPRVLTEDNGIYGGEIESPPDGLYTITISVFVGEDYEFEDFTITLNVEAYVPGAQPDLGWLIYVLTGAMIGLVGIFTLYQTHFKYPPLVRKIRKLKKIVRKAKKSKPILVNKRDEIITNSLQNQINILATKSIQPEKDVMIEKTPIKKEEEV